MAWRDWFIEIVEACFRMVPIPARTGVQIIGQPDRESPIFLTGNYDLTVRRIRRTLQGLNAYLIVANSHGVNVWCAASGGHFGTHQVVTALKLAQLEHRVVHREVIVPQLAATGVEGKEVRRRSGWIVRFGPADARDIPAYLAADKKKTQAMRQVRFGWQERIQMAAAWAAPISLVAALIAALINWSSLPGALTLIWATAFGIFFCYDRLPLSERGRQTIMGLGVVGGVQAVLILSGMFAVGTAFGWGIAAVAVVRLLTFDFAGSSPTAAAGVFEEKDFQVVLDTHKCVGAYTCWAVCPEAVFEKQPEIRKVALTSLDRCIRCGACLVQCPQDALAFETPDGRRVGPETIRRFKLNMMGKRAVQAGTKRSENSTNSESPDSPEQ